MGLIIDKTMRIIDQNLPRALRMVGEETVDELKEVLSGSSPSEPGSPPGRDTGALQRGISYEVQDNTLSIISEREGGDPSVPEWLNYGTKKMEARPYWEDSVSHLDERVSRVFKREV